MSNESRAMLFLYAWGGLSLLLAALLSLALWSAGAFANEGAAPGTVALTGGVAVAVVIGRQVAEVLAKSIPDSATGWLGTLRKVCKILSGYVVNKS